MNSDSYPPSPQDHFMMMHYYDDALLIQPQTEVSAAAAAAVHSQPIAMSGLREGGKRRGGRPGRMSMEHSALRDVLKNSRFSTCTDVQTLDSTPSLITDENGLASNGFIHSILTRRLGLIVGCCLGIVVFIVMISILSYVKLKKQRIENAKRRTAMPPDYMSYRHFSIPNEDPMRGGAAGGGVGSIGGGTTATTISSVPSGISAHISGTSLSNSGNNTATTVTTAASTPMGILKAAASSETPMADLTAAATIGVVSSDVAVNLATTPTLPARVDNNNQNHQLALRNQQQQQAFQHHHHAHHHLLEQQQQQQQGNGNIGGHLQATTMHLSGGGPIGGQHHLGLGGLAPNQHYSSHPDAC